MVKAIQCYEDAAGNLHKDAFGAHVADLALWLKDTKLLNEGSSVALADAMSQQTECASLRAILEQLDAHRVEECAA